MKRSLALKKETLASLTPEDMAAVGGGADSLATCGPACDITPLISASYLAPTNCCHTIPTFHVAGGAAC